MTHTNTDQKHSVDLEDLRTDIVHILVSGEPVPPPIKSGGYRLSGLSAPALQLADRIVDYIATNYTPKTTQQKRQAVLDGEGDAAA